MYIYPNTDNIIHHITSTIDINQTIRLNLSPSINIIKLKHLHLAQYRTSATTIHTRFHGHERPQSPWNKNQNGWVNPALEVRFLVDLHPETRSTKNAVVSFTHEPRERVEDVWKMVSFMGRDDGRSRES